MALSGHSEASHQCPLLGVKLTLRERRVLSAFDPKRTSKLMVVFFYPEFILKRVQLARNIELNLKNIPTAVSRAQEIVFAGGVKIGPELR
jgi:hypothetical protein